MSLIDLWDIKARLGESRPFNAQRDIFDVAIDIINAVAFGLDEEQSTVKRQLDFLERASSDFRPTLDVDSGAAVFPVLPVLPNIEAIEAISHHLGDQFKVPFPRLVHRFQMWTDRTLAGHYDRKNAFIRDEIDKAVVRLRKGESGTRSAMDYVLQREMNAADKAGREPIYHSPTIHDEVRMSSIAWQVETRQRGCG